MTPLMMQACSSVEFLKDLRRPCVQKKQCENKDEHSCFCWLMGHTVIAFCMSWIAAQESLLGSSLLFIAWHTPYTQINIQFSSHHLLLISTDHTHTHAATFLLNSVTPRLLSLREIHVNKQISSRLGVSGDACSGIRCSLQNAMKVAIVMLPNCWASETDSVWYPEMCDVSLHFAVWGNKTWPN